MDQTLLRERGRCQQRLGLGLSVWKWLLQLSSADLYLEFRIAVWALMLREGGGTERERGIKGGGGVNQEGGGCAVGFQRGDEF